MKNKNKFISFWEERAKNKFEFIHSASNLTSDPKIAKKKHAHELDVLSKVLKLNGPYNSAIDFGAGTCQWTPLLSELSKNVLCFDNSKSMLELGKKYMVTLNKKNITFSSKQLIDLAKHENTPFDLFFVSGVLLYMDDILLEDFCKFISQTNSSKSSILLREPIGIDKEFKLDNIYSEALASYYSANYRTRDQIIEIFENLGYNLEDCFWMHPEDSKLNKWKETKLSVFYFRKIK